MIFVIFSLGQGGRIGEADPGTNHLFRNALDKCSNQAPFVEREMRHYWGVDNLTTYVQITMEKKSERQGLACRKHHHLTE